MPTINELPQATGGSETLLWSSTSTSSGAFTMTLSQAATDYDYIRIEYYTFSNEGLVEAVTLKVEDLDGFTGGTNTGVVALGAKGAQYYYSRLGYFNSAYTTISWTTSYRAGASNTNNAYCLPKAVYGIK